MGPWGAVRGEGKSLQPRTWKRKGKAVEMAPPNRGRGTQLSPAISRRASLSVLDKRGNPNSFHFQSVVEGAGRGGGGRAGDSRGELYRRRGGGGRSRRASI